MNRNELNRIFHEFSDEEKYRAIELFFKLTESTVWSMALRGPYKFILDSNVVMRFEEFNSGVVKEGLFAVMLFFDFYNSQTQFKADFVITPVVFYEFFRLQNVDSLKNYWEKFKSLRSLIEDTLNIDILFEGLFSYEITEVNISKIIKDHNSIKRKLEEIKMNSFNYKFNRSPKGVTGVLRNDGTIDVSPIFAADHVYKPFKTSYFNSEIVSLFMKDHIAHKMTVNPDNDIKIRDKCNYGLREVLHLDSKGRVKGLADIELLTACNVRYQFGCQKHGNYFPVSIPITIDKNLTDALKNMAGHSVSSEEIMLGDEMGLTHLERSFDDASRRMGRSKRQQESLSKSISDYALELKQWLV